MGIGVAMAVEGAGWNTYTAAMAQHYVPTLDYATVTMRMDTSGNVKVLIGDVACGTSHATTAAQVAADATGLPIDTIEVVEGDTAVTPYDSGTRAARFSAVVLPAVAESGMALKKKVCRVGAHLLEGAEEDMEIVEGQVQVRGVPDRSLPVSRVARVAYSEVATLPHEIPAGLEATESFKAPMSGLCITWPYSIHIPVVEVDIETGTVKFLRYAIVHDCGVEVNPMVVEGQVVGGTAQGVGGTLLEELVYDEDGQLLTTSFMDYLIPTATDMPSFDVMPPPDRGAADPGRLQGHGGGRLRLRLRRGGERRGRRHRAIGRGDHLDPALARPHPEAVAGGEKPTLTNAARSVGAGFQTRPCPGRRPARDTTTEDKDTCVSGS